jgi:hypothetical protein
VNAEIWSKPYCCKLPYGALSLACSPNAQAGWFTDGFFLIM